MPESEAPDAGADNEAMDPAAGFPEVEQEVARLEAVVGSIVDGFDAMRGRAMAAEDNHRKLAEALRDTDLEDMAPTELQKRLEELAAENGRLRSAVAEARARAERIRSRLMLMEDEQADD